MANSNKFVKSAALSFISFIIVASIIFSSFYSYKILSSPIPSDDALTKLRAKYIPLVDAMADSGYKIDDNKEYSFIKETPNSEIRISFDLQKGQCTKNDYVFSISTSDYYIEDQPYIYWTKLSAIINQNYSYTDNTLKKTTAINTPHDWADKYPPLVAHAGGTIDQHSYSNSYEALVENYNLGHRIFEIDFRLTSDHNLAAVHSWENYGNEDGMPMSTEEWQKYKIYDEYTTMDIEKVLDQMLINQDMYLITDTKLDKPEVMKEQFTILYDAAMAKDPQLLERIIPQIYNEEMYDIVTAIYSFPSIIYTLYESPDTNEDIIKFVEKKDDIKVIAMWKPRATPEFVTQLKEIDKYIYIHTYNTLKDLQAIPAKGIHGLYTDDLTPTDYEAFIASLPKEQSKAQ